MISFHRCALGISLALFSSTLGFATPSLTAIQDMLYSADGTAFSGFATISWQSFVASDGSNIAAQSITTQIVNGLLEVQLVPTTSALSAASYTVVYNSGASIQFTEYWAVPPSNVPLPVSAIRISAPGTVIGTGGTTGPGQDTTLTIAGITGLTSALNIRPTMGAGYTASRAAVIDATGAIAGAVGNLSDCLHVDGTSGPCGTSTSSSGTFVDGETPGGLVNGLNGTFTLANAPSPSTSLSLYRNGLLQQQGGDYTISNSTITFLGSAAPQSADVLAAFYRMDVDIAGVAFVDEETPGGTINGVNASFTLSQTPNPAASLVLYRNGLIEEQNVDYTLSGNTIVFVSGSAPQPGDVLLASYQVGL